MTSDAQIRYQALSPTRSFIVQAPAGSGKTSLLVYRILNLLLTVDEPEQILAITFTNKATDEMHQRVFDVLRKAQLGESAEHDFEQYGLDLAHQVLQRDQQRDWQLFACPHRLQISTIDALCAKLTGAIPWLSRMGDKANVTDQPERHYRAAINALMQISLDSSHDLHSSMLDVLDMLDFDYGKLQQMFMQMLVRRDQWLRHLVPVADADLAHQLEIAWQSIMQRHVDYVNRSVPKSIQTELFFLAKQAAEYLDAENGVNPFAYAMSLAELPSVIDVELLRCFAELLFTKDGPLRSPRGITKKMGFPPEAKQSKVRLAEIIESLDEQELWVKALLQVRALPTQVFSAQQNQQLTALRQVLLMLASLLQLQFRQHGECDFVEIARRANLALQEMQSPTELGLRLDYQIQHILVDEFQDTSHVQLELIRKLTAGWQHHADEQSHTLFLVGDPMQSIYRFREADVSLFMQVVEQAEANTSAVFDNLQLSKLTLSANFRSKDNLVAWYNRVFAQSFPAQSHIGEGAIPYSASLAALDSSPQSSVDVVVAEDEAQEIQHIVDTIATAIERLKGDKKIAVLVQSRNRLIGILEALNTAGIAYQGVDLQALNRNQQVIDVLTLLRVLIDDTDRIAWLALLRSPWVGLCLDELTALVERSDNDVWQLLVEYDLSLLEGSSQKRVTRLVAVLDSARRQRHHVDLVSLLRWCWFELGGMQTLGETRFDDIEMVFEIIRQTKSDHSGQLLKEVEARLDRLFAQSQSSDAAVVVSTMHKAKGLQYDTVILPGLNAKTKAESKQILMWNELLEETGQARLLLAPFEYGAEPGSRYQFLRELDKRKEQHQLLRLMYVAATRAERQLLMTATLAKEENGEWRKPQSSSLLATVWEAISDEIQGVEKDIIKEGSDEPVSISAPSISNDLMRLPAGYQTQRYDNISWSAKQQLIGAEDDIGSGALIEYDWASEVAKATGIVLHEWLQFNQASILSKEVDDETQSAWRAELSRQLIPASHIDKAVQRLVQAVNAIKADTQHHFIFQNYAEQKNEWALSHYHKGAVDNYRIDRTFVDDNNIRWVIDYKTTITQRSDLDAFVAEQVEQRYRDQLQRYGDLVAQIDSRVIHLGVYFPLLSRLYYWRY